MKNKITKNQLIIGIIGLTLVIVLIILLSGGGRKTTEVAPTPTETPVKSNTGAILITPNPTEQVIQTETSLLRSKTPIDTDTFVLDFDWKNIYFTVKPKNTNFQMFEVTKWLDANEYGAIPISNFKIIK